MRATIIGDDYYITFEKEKQEICSLKKGVQLEGRLVEEGNKNLDKKVTVKTVAGTNNPDGIDVKYVPKHQGWQNVREIRVRLNQSALEQIELLGRFGTRYGLGNTIEFYDGLPSR